VQANIEHEYDPYILQEQWMNLKNVW